MTVNDDERTPRYIAVDGMRASIIRKCDDSSCNRYHEWISLDGSGKRYEAEQIAKAMNEMESR